jgi:hypothetical protein
MSVIPLPADMGIWTEADTNPDADGHEIRTLAATKSGRAPMRFLRAL